MRFVSKYKRYQINFQREVVQHFGTGESQEIQPLLNCEFDRYGSMHQWEIEAALKHWKINNADGFSGMPTEADEVTLVSPIPRLSVFDTDLFAASKGLDEEKKQKLEEFLLSRPEHGIDYILIEAPALVAPWPNYDKVKGDRAGSVAEKIARTVAENGFDVAYVVAYERSKKNRDDVIAAVEALAAVDDEPLVAA